MHTDRRNRKSPGHLFSSQLEFEKSILQDLCRIFQARCWIHQYPFARFCFWKFRAKSTVHVRSISLKTRIHFSKSKRTFQEDSLTFRLTRVWSIFQGTGPCLKGELSRYYQQYLELHGPNKRPTRCEPSMHWTLGR